MLVSGGRCVGKRREWGRRCVVLVRGREVCW